MSHLRTIALLSIFAAAALCACSGSDSSERSAPKKVDSRLLLFGVDGATWDLMDPLLKEGLLPNFKKLIDHGVRSPLKTYKPTLSPLIWTTIATGFAPKKHGIEGFTAKVRGTDEKVLVTSNMRKVKAVWNILSEHEKTVGVIGWWASYPAQKVNGFVISDQAGTLRKENYRIALDLKPAADDDKIDPKTTWPPSLATELKDHLRLSSKIDAAIIDRFFELDAKQREELAQDGIVDKEDILSIFKFAYLIDRSFIDSGLVALEKHKPDFGALYLNGLDAAEHHFWKYFEPGEFENVREEDIARYEKVIRRYYVYMDEILGRLMKLYPLESSTIMVVSDHGHEANANYDPSSSNHYNRICSGGHEEAPDGVFIMGGVLAGRGKIPAPNVFDVTPTILTLMGTPVGRDMPGKTVMESIDRKFLGSHPPTKVNTHGPNPFFSQAPVPSAMNDALKEKLRGLGYIE